jgi:hypothetical protein
VVRGAEQEVAVRTFLFSLAAFGWLVAWGETQHPPQRAKGSIECFSDGHGEMSFVDVYGPFFDAHQDEVRRRLNDAVTLVCREREA